MNVKERILLGSIGGVTPILVTLLVIDMKMMVESYDMYDWIGLLVRGMILLFLGALTAYMHQKETDRFKVFQLGMAAPALLAAAINGYAEPIAGHSHAIVTSSLTSSVNQGSVQHRQSVSVLFITNAIADETKTDGITQFSNVSFLRDPQIAPVDRFLRGLIGKEVVSHYEWFVIVGSHTSKDLANLQVQDLKAKNYKGVVYSRIGDSKYYSVVIASNVSQSEARQVQLKAVADGLPSDTFVWK